MIRMTVGAFPPRRHRAPLHSWRARLQRRRSLGRLPSPIHGGALRTARDCDSPTVILIVLIILLAICILFALHPCRYAYGSIPIADVVTQLCNCKQILQQKFSFIPCRNSRSFLQRVETVWELLGTVLELLRPSSQPLGPEKPQNTS